MDQSYDGLGDDMMVFMDYKMGMDEMEDGQSYPTSVSITSPTYRPTRYQHKQQSLSSQPTHTPSISLPYPRFVCIFIHHLSMTSIINLLCVYCLLLLDEVLNINMSLDRDMQHLQDVL